MKRRVFISFASPNLGLAERLQDDLTKRGASVFQFNKSARPGRSAWDQVYNNIDESDYFLSLLSRDAVKSRPVNKEIEYADHQNTNHDGWPVLVESKPLEPKKWPQALRVLTPLDLSDYESDPSKYESSLAQLVALMGIGEKVDERQRMVEGIDDEVGERQATEPRDLAKIAVQFAGSPRQSEAPSEVQWTIEIENVGTGDLQSVRATLDQHDLGEPFSLAVGETRRVTKTSRYAFPRSKPRTLRVRAVGGDGTPVAVEQSASVEVTGSPTATADEVEITDDQLRDRLEAESSAPEFAWSAIGYPIFTLTIGAAAATGAVFVTEFLLGHIEEYLFVDRPTYLPSLLYQTLEWIGTTKWVHWTSGVLAGLCIAGYTWVAAEDEFPIDVIDYAKITIISSIVAFLISSVFGRWPTFF